MKDNRTLNEIAAEFGIEESGYIINFGAGTMDKPSNKIHIAPNSIYYLGASSSPKMILVTKVDDKTIVYFDPWGGGKTQRIETWIGKDLITKGVSTQLKSYGGHMSPQEKTTLQNNLDGKPGPLNGKAKASDWARIEVEVRGNKKAEPKWKEEDFYYYLERFGNVGSKSHISDTGDFLYTVEMWNSNLNDLKKDKKVEILGTKTLWSFS